MRYNTKLTNHLNQNGSTMIASTRRFFGQYKKLGMVLIAMITSAILSLSGFTEVANWILGITATIIAIPLAVSMVQTLRSGQYGIDLLAVTAIATSVLLQEYWAGIVIVLMLTGGEALEDYAERRAKTELTALLEHKPKKTHILRGRKTVDIAVSDVLPGDKLIILPGEVVPVDAIIFEGSSNFDESSLTGESIPVEKTKGQKIMSGAINIDGAITVKALRAAADSQYEQIIKLVKSASTAQSPFVRLADRYSIPFTFVSFFIAGTAWAISGDPVRFLQVLVVATPCPLLLAAPIALISGMSRAARNGIIVKTGSALEKLAESKTVAFDKTGTLTIGQPAVGNIVTFDGHSEKEILAHAAALEEGSTHVLAQAIVDAAHAQGVSYKKAKQIKEESGNGLSGRLNGKYVLVGRLGLLHRHDVTLPEGFSAKNIKHTATFVAINGKLAGFISFQDEIRPEAPAMLAQLRSYGIKNIAMVTGDNQTTANKVAQELGIDEVYAESLPSDKLRAVEKMYHRPIAFVGDGVNDAPVLTAADVGIALGARGATAASETADVVIMLDDVSRVSKAVQIAQRTFAIARQSILIGIFISLVLMGIFATGKFPPVYGALLQEVVDVIVILNALRAHGKWDARRKYQIATAQ